MKFIRLPKPINIAERVLPKLVVDWADPERVQSININAHQPCKPIYAGLMSHHVVEMINTSSVHLQGFHTSGMRHMRLEQP
jgi:hypothetical protein